MAQSKPNPAAGGVVGGAKAPRAPTPWLLPPPRVLGLAIGFLVIAFLVYQPAWHAGFIWDDDDHLTANPAMTAPHGLRMIWSSMAVSRYYPLTLTSFWVQRRLWGLDPMPYHLVNIALHAINALFVFLMLRRLRIRGALLAALIWLVHPVNVESVAWVTELKNTQSGFFFFATILCFLQAAATAEKPHISPNDTAAAGYPETTRGIPPYKRPALYSVYGWYALALLCGAAAMLSKPSTVILPLTLLLCVWWERGRWRRTDIMRIIPFLALTAGMSVLTVLEQRWQISRSGPADWPAGMAPLGAGQAQRFAMAGRAVWFYAAKLVWPAPLVFVYPRWTLDTAPFRLWMPLLGLVAVGIVLWAWRRRAWGRAGIFGVGYFVTALLPVLGFFDIYFFHYSFVADHFQYLASVGLIALATSAIVNLGTPDKSGSRRLQLRQESRVLLGPARLSRTLKGAATWLPVSGPLVASAVLLILGALTWRQAQVYRDAETLWLDTLAKNPDCWMAEHNLANLLLHRGDVPEAIAHWQRALQIDPHLPEVCNNLGTVLFKAGRVPEAIRYWEQAVDSDPDYFGAHYNLGTVLIQQGQLDEGLSHLEQAVRIDGDSFEARLTLATALVQADKGLEAIAELEQAVRIKPNSSPTRSRLAWLLATAPPAKGGDPARAVEQAQRACELTRDPVAANFDVLAIAYAAAGRFDDAVATAQKALDLARASGQTKLAGEIEARLELYRSGRAYHPSSTTAATSPPSP